MEKSCGFAEFLTRRYDATACSDFELTAFQDNRPLRHFCFEWEAMSKFEDECLENQDSILYVPRAPLFCKALKSYNLPAARARELFKPPTDSTVF